MNRAAVTSAILVVVSGAADATAATSAPAPAVAHRQCPGLKPLPHDWSVHQDRHRCWLLTPHPQRHLAWWRPAERLDPVLAANRAASVLGDFLPGFREMGRALSHAGDGAAVRLTGIAENPFGGDPWTGMALFYQRQGRLAVLATRGTDDSLPARVRDLLAASRLI
jgi:hypothetical protein